MSKALIIYHEVKPGIPCPDGAAAAWVAHRFYPHADILGRTYNSSEPLPDTSSYKTVVVVDFSFPASVLEEWSGHADITVIDHHKTALNDLQGLSGAVTKRFDMDECGATLAWVHFFPDEPVPEFLWYVRDRDLWHKCLSFTEYVHNFHGVLRKNLDISDSHNSLFDAYDALSLLNKEQLTTLAFAITADAVMERRDAVFHAAKRARILSLQGGERLPVVILKRNGSEDGLYSDVCERLYKITHPDADYVACISSDNKVHLRSNKNAPGGGYDVSKVAKALGGGGHKNASGYGPIKMSWRLRWDAFRSGAYS